MANLFRIVLESIRVADAPLEDLRRGHARPAAAAALAALALAALLPAQTCPPGSVLCQPGSLLLFPEYDDRAFFEPQFGNLEDQDGRDYLVTVTNTHPTLGVDVEFLYIDATTCLEFNRTEPLTAYDTISVVTRFHNPKGNRGYLYVFAKSPLTGQPIRFDHLIGDEIVYDGSAFGAFDYSHKAFTFRAGAGLPEGAPTDVDFDGVRDLNGVEYRQAPDEILIPRFLGQQPQGTPQSELILIALTGGAAFTTAVDFLVYNDNEEVFSAQHTFRCWTKRELAELSIAFSQAFLESTNHATNEILGSPGVESGWLRIDGSIASSTAATLGDPAVLAVLVERQGVQAVADLPFGSGAQDNGDLLPHGVFGDVSGP